MICVFQSPMAIRIAGTIIPDCHSSLEGPHRTQGSRLKAARALRKRGKRLLPPAVCGNICWITSSLINKKPSMLTKARGRRSSSVSFLSKLSAEPSREVSNLPSLNYPSGSLNTDTSLNRRWVRSPSWLRKEPFEVARGVPLRPRSLPQGNPGCDRVAAPL